MIDTTDDADQYVTRATATPTDPLDLDGLRKLAEKAKAAIAKLRAHNLIRRDGVDAYVRDARPLAEMADELAGCAIELLDRDGLQSPVLELIKASRKIRFNKNPSAQDWQNLKDAEDKVLEKLK